MNMAKLFALRKGSTDGKLVTYTICFRRNEECMFTDTKGCTYIKEKTVFLPLYDMVGWEDELETRAWQEFDWLTDHDAAELTMIFDHIADSNDSDRTQEQKTNCKYVSTWFKRAIYDGRRE